ncbi:MAG TPA: hypothetical protein VGR73_20365 [Bryobacteraceae bacterium]|nr:hypothetical protein [Bryobacteraceae bacterium]
MQRSAPVTLSLETKLRLEALAAIHQQPAFAILERALLAYVASLPGADRGLVESLAARARQSLSSQTEAGGSAVRNSETVTGKEFKYRGSIDSGLEILFERSQPLRITRESIDKIRAEIMKRKGPALMGAIYDPLMPNSIGKAIMDDYKLTPIVLSYVIPLLAERKEVRAFKGGRNWYVEALASPSENG